MTNRGQKFKKQRMEKIKKEIMKIKQKKGTDKIYFF